MKEYLPSFLERHVTEPGKDAASRRAWASEAATVRSSALSQFEVLPPCSFLQMSREKLGKLKTAIK